MAWYRAGTVAVTNGSAVITGAGTAWVGNVQIGHAINLPDGNAYEVLSVDSNTQITLGSAYLGATASGQPYSVQPNQGFAQAAATLVTGFMSQISGWVAGALAGRFGDGSTAAPGISFSADQDTGICRVGANLLGLVSGGNLGATLDAQGLLTLKAISLNGDATQHITRSYANPGYQPARLALGVATDHVVFEAGATAENNTPGQLAILTKDSGGNLQERMRIDPVGNFGIGTATPAAYGGYTSLTVGGGAHGLIALRSPSGQSALFQTNFGGNGPAIGTSSAHPLLITVNSAEVARFDQSGNLLIGTTSAANHTVAKSVGQGSIIFNVSATAAGGGTCAVFVGVSAYSPNGSGAALYVGHSTATNRSINTSGTINASGADYAEYMTKADGCAKIAKGQIVGVDENGNLTDRFSLMVSPVVKSTDPSLVGGDVYGKKPKPVEPTYEAPAYDGPAVPEPGRTAPAPLASLPPAPEQPVRGSDESEDDWVTRLVAFTIANSAYIAAVSAAPALLGQWQAATQAAADDSVRFATEKAAYDQAQATWRDQVTAAEAAHDAAMQTYTTDLAAWEADLEAERQKVDRIAFSGQVPCNVEAGTFAPGDYIVAAEGPNDTIVGVAMKAAAMALGDYQRRVGKVWRVMDDGRAWIDVQHG